MFAGFVGITCFLHGASTHGILSIKFKGVVFMLFESFELKGKTIKNRLVYPPVVIFDKDVKDGKINAEVVAHYNRIAAAGCGIMIVEATAIEATGRLHETQLGIWDDTFVEGLSALPKAAHAENAVALIQIMHAGIQAPPTVSSENVSSSDCKRGDKAARAMTTEEIEHVKQQFLDAGKRAKKAGFDGVELHACHGYLLNQFLSPQINTRDDIYGKEKSKIVIDIIKEMRHVMGEDFIIAIRMPGNDPDLAGSITYAKAFEAAGVDLFHISAGIPNGQPADMKYEENNMYNWIVASAMEIKKQVTKPVIAVNGIRNPKQATAILQDVDFIALARGYLCDLNWLEKAKTDQPVKECIGCKGCTRGRRGSINDCVLN